MILRVVIAAILLSTVSISALAGDAPSSKDIVLSMIKAVNERDFDSLDLYVAENVQRHSAATPGVVVESLADFKEFLHQDLSAVPDAVQTVNLIFEADDMVAVHATYAGTQTGQMGPFPPSGKRLEIQFIGLLRIENGKIAELWVEWDNLGALMHLGHLPPPPPPGKPDAKEH